MMGRGWNTRRALLALGGLGWALVHPLAAGAQTITIGLAAPANTVDPHFYNGTPTKALALHIFDRLVEQNADNKLVPGLALSWRPLEETVWEFKLRPGVRFSNGQPLAPEDIAFTVERARDVPNSPGGFAGVVRQIVRVEIIDPTTIHIHTQTPAPNLPNDLSNLAIISKAVGEGATTEDYNTGKAAIGTGPFRLVRYTHGQGVEFERNDGWWGPKPDWERASFKYLPNAGARSAALLSGAVDVIDAPSPNDLPRFRQNSDFKVYSHQGMRLIYLAPDQGGDDPSPFITAADGSRLERNPLQDVRVRRALSIAINREALSDRVMQGTASPNGQWVPPGTYSYNPDVPVPPFNPDAAKKLLVEAGYPNGFRITVHASNDSRPTDPITVQAVAQMWSRIGVPTTVETLPSAAFSARSTKREFAMGLWGWGSNSGESGYALINVVNTPNRERGTGAYNRAWYSNPTVDALTAKAMSTLDPDAREALLRQAVGIVMKDDVGFIPLYQLSNFWVARKGISYEASGHERTNAMAARLVR